MNEEERKKEKAHVLLELDENEKYLACLESKARRFVKQFQKMIDHLEWDEGPEENTFSVRPPLDANWQEMWPTKEELSGLLNSINETRNEIASLRIMKSKMGM